MMQIKVVLNISIGGNMWPFLVIIEIAIFCGMNVSVVIYFLLYLQGKLIHSNVSAS